MIVGGYSLHLYCDFPDEGWQHRGGGEYPGPGMGEFAGQGSADTHRQARAAGWQFKLGSGRVLCPWCISQNRKLPDL